MENNKLTASEGCILRRKADGTLFGNTVYLGYVYRVNGKVLKTPYLESEDNYEEVRPIEFDGLKLYIVNSDYESMVRELIANKYLIQDEIALINNYILDNEKYKDEYNEYLEYRLKVKEFIKTIL